MHKYHWISSRYHVMNSLLILHMILCPQLETYVINICQIESFAVVLRLQISKKSNLFLVANTW
jgi:hypothetical protein